MIHVVVLLVSVPGRETDVERWFAARKRTLGGNEGLTGDATLCPVLGPYDFVLEASCESADDVGMLVGWLREEVREWVERTVTVIETNQVATEEARDGSALAAWVLLRMGPEGGSPETEEDLVKVGGCVSRVSAVFGEYDYVVRLGVNGYEEAVATVRTIRGRLGKRLAASVTLLEAKLRPERA